jgi:hypothetical protein
VILKLIVGSLIASSLLYSNSLTIQGVWNGGGKDVYTKGNAQYCFKADDNSTIELQLNTTKNIYSTIYVTYGNVIASGRWINPYLKVQNLSPKMYKVILAPDTAQVNSDFTLDVTYSGVFGKCSDYYQAGFLGMTIEDTNMILALSGVFTALLFFGSITYVILTLGNF